MRNISENQKGVVSQRHRDKSHPESDGNPEVAGHGSQNMFKEAVHPLVCTLSFLPAVSQEHRAQVNSSIASGCLDLGKGWRREAREKD